MLKKTKMGHPPPHSQSHEMPQETHCDPLIQIKPKMERPSPPPSPATSRLPSKKPRVRRSRKGLESPDDNAQPSPAQPKRSSIYRGVTKHRWTGRYEAHLWDKHCWNPIQNKKGRQVYLGAYDDEAAAARTYDLAALKYWGAETILNFPLSTYTKEYQEMQRMSREEYLASLRRRSSGFSRGASKYRGVAKHHHNGRWEARIGRVYGNKYLYLGTFNTQEEAARAYDLAALEYRGPNAVTNFDISFYINKRPNPNPIQVPIPIPLQTQHHQLFGQPLPLLLQPPPPPPPPPHHPKLNPIEPPPMEVLDSPMMAAAEPQADHATIEPVTMSMSGFDNYAGVSDPMGEMAWTSMCTDSGFMDHRQADYRNFFENDGFMDDIDGIFDGCGLLGSDLNNAAAAGTAIAANDFGGNGESVYTGGILDNPAKTEDGLGYEVGQASKDQVELEVSAAAAAPAGAGAGAGAGQVNSAGTYTFPISICS